MHVKMIHNRGGGAKDKVSIHIWGGGSRGMLPQGNFEM